MHSLELCVSGEDLMYSCCQVTYIRLRNLRFAFFFFFFFLPLYLEALGANILNETFASMEPINNTRPVQGCSLIHAALGSQGN